VQLINLLYTNVVGQGPSTGELNEFLALLENGTFTQTSLAVEAAFHPLNSISVGLIGLVDTGLQYTPLFNWLT
jgi:hypothetical protein